MLNALLQLAHAAGGRILEIYDRGAHGVGQKTDGSPVTEADLSANAMIVEGLLKIAPQLPILSEESGWTGECSDIFWAVDPLDGTKEFIARNGEFTVNIALVAQGVPILGLVHAPVLHKTWLGVAADGVSLPFELACPEGAWLLQVDPNQTGGLSGYPWQPIHGQPIAGDRPVVVAASRSHPSPLLERWLSQFGQGVQVEKTGSSLKLCLVAQGRAHVYPRFGPTSIWDTAAGHAVMRGAGGFIEKACMKNGRMRGEGVSLKYAPSSSTLNPYFIAWGKALP